MYDLRPHQIKCKDAIAEHFKNKNKGLVKMFCGAGKSYIIYDSLLCFGGKLSIVVVPSINLITQFKKDYLLDKAKYNKNNYNKKFDTITICSKDEVKDKDTIFTTDDDEITDFLEQDDDKIVLITYQSLKKLIDIVKNNEFNIDLICFDEAHHILGMKMKHLLFGHDEEEFNEEIEDSDSDDSIYDSEFCGDFLSNNVNKSLFFTATPLNKNKIVMYEPYQIVVNDIEYDIIDDENTEVADEPHCGKMVYEYMHLNGVNDDVLNDFKIRLDMYTENKDESVFEAISRTILETGNSRVLTFHSRSEKSNGDKSNVIDFSKKKDEFIECFNKVTKKEFPKLKDKYKKISFEGFTGKTKDRISILNEFDETPDNEIFIIASCKTIGEGVDTKKANCVVFVDPKQSYSEIIQNIGRVCRKQDNLSTVLIPCYVDVDKYKKCKTDEDRDNVIRQEMNKVGDFNGILNVLSALRQEDPYMFELCLKYPETYTDKEISNNLKRKGLVVNNKEYDIDTIFEKNDLVYKKKLDEKENFERLSDKIGKNIQVVNNKLLDDDIFIDGKYDETEYFVKTDEGKIKKAKNNDDVSDKIKKPNRNIKPDVCMNDELKVLWKVEGDVDMNKKIFGGYINATVVGNKEDYWFEMLDKVKQYIDKYERMPSSEDKDKNIKKMGGWLLCQIQNHRKNIRFMKNKKIKWEDFLEKYNEYFQSNEKMWCEKLDTIKKYIDDNKKRPSRGDKNNNIKQLASWINTQKNNYAKKDFIMKQSDIRNKWEKFVEKYKEYFRSNEEIWHQKLNDVKKYIDKNKKRPSTGDENDNIKQLGTWITRQKNNYAKKIELMEQYGIRSKWEEFIKKYNEYFRSNDELWCERLDDIKKYINDNKKRPSLSDKNKETMRLGAWINTQQCNYAKEDNIMKQKNIRNKWKEFVEQYKKYFQSNEELWYNTLKEVDIYINEHDKRPAQSSNNRIVKTLGNWIADQQKNYIKCVQIMENKHIRNKWDDFIIKHKKHFSSQDELWNKNLEDTKKYIDKYKKIPSSGEKSDVRNLGRWVCDQVKNYKNTKNKGQFIKRKDIQQKWEEFIDEYKKYVCFESNEEHWQNQLINVREYIKSNNKKPPCYDKNDNTKKLGEWVQRQIYDYSKKVKIMKRQNIRQKWEEFITEHRWYFPDNPAIQEQEKKSAKKSTTIIPKTQIQKEPTEQKRALSEYQELTKKMVTQKSTNNKQMFEEKPKLWEDYHSARDFSFKGYDKQEEIPVNKIISYLETKKNHKLKILDLGCGRNLIKEHFKENKKFDITGYDFVSFNGSKVADISDLPEEDESIKICIYSQSLMGSNWEEYLKEGYRVLEYNGEMIISESVERYDKIKKYVGKIKMHIIKEDYNETNRWFFIYAIKQ